MAAKGKGVKKRLRAARNERKRPAWKKLLTQERRAARAGKRRAKTFAPGPAPFPLRFIPDTGMKPGTCEHSVNTLYGRCR